MFRRHRSGRKGAEAIEFAFILPIYLGVILGIVEFGRAFQVAQWLTAAAREGGRLAMLYNVISQNDRDQGITSGNHKVEVDIKNFMRAAGVEGVTVSIEGVNGGAFDIDDYANSAGEYFRVKVQVPYENVKLMTPIYMSNSQILTGEIVLRHE